MTSKNIAILGGGNLGSSIAKGLVKSGLMTPQQITITNLDLELIQHLHDEDGFNITTDNISAINGAQIVIIAVKPTAARALLNQVKGALGNGEHVVISVISGIKIHDLEEILGDMPIIRAMPNTAIAIQESMTALSFNEKGLIYKQEVSEIFNQLGSTMLIPEAQMPAATVLASCGIAFALRFLRAASQGGIEIGFSSKLSLEIAAQIMKGASKLIIENNSHPEPEIDKVTTPLGVTIKSLNKMEYEGFSSSLIQGVVAGYNKILETES
ncbi:pyrroline-5-carboxylate reductase [Carboxylicivirga mesophila]|uniref:Pyrroline-5-carboxylate reductase n=1 Tax=Carboxylicivirga mesophila TaxID=1166478 RepID=A0ABS5K847_9BACT|nr:pyrroline-5-carboxylate reductase [Carboxylicivirga mesophila]MBS2211179.1 pyrroline-5-carboxylate reductase [Carboxylicivirga mesophila]